MPRTVRVTERDLRGAMRDERYRHPGHPERGAFAAWVASGFRGLYPSDGAARDAVRVRAYDRDGQRVSAHRRGAAPRGAGGGDGPRGAEVVPANWRSILRRGANRAPPDRGSGGGASGRPGRGRNPQRPDAEGRDAVDDLRGRPATRRETNLRDGVDQWNRPGGEAGRAQDLERLRPVGPPTALSDGRQLYRLEDGRTAITRPSTSPGSDGVPTLEIFEPTGRPNRFRTTDKFRYPPAR